MGSRLRPLFFLTAWSVSLLFIACHLWFAWETEDRITDDPGSVPAGSVAVVLGCNEFDEDEGWRVAPYHPRLDAAARLAASGRVREVIVSGYLGQADAMARELRRRGVAVPIVRDPWGWRTIDSVVRARGIRKPPWSLSPRAGMPIAPCGRRAGSAPTPAASPPSTARGSAPAS